MSTALVPYRGRGGVVSVPMGSGKLATAANVVQLLANYPEAVSAVARSVSAGGQYVMKHIGRRRKEQVPAVIELKSAPVAKNFRFKPRPPVFGARGADGSMTITHTELMGRVPNGGTAGNFTLAAFLMNPLNASVFPWLSMVAGGYLTYSFESLSFTIIPSVATSAVGNMYMAMQYDVSSQPVINSRQEMSQFKPVEGRLWDKMTLTADRKRLNLRTNYVRADADNPAVMSQCGRLIVATQYTNLNFQNGMGDVLVTYRIKLSTPIGNSTGLLGFTATGASQCLPTLPFGNSIVSSGDAAVRYDLSLASNVLVLPFTGTYYLFYEGDGSGYAPGQGSLASHIDSLIVLNGNYNSVSTSWLATATAFRQYHCLTVTDAPCEITLVYANSASAVITFTSLRGFISGSMTPPFTMMPASASLALGQAKLTLQCAAQNKAARIASIRSQLEMVSQERRELDEAAAGLKLSEDDFVHVGASTSRPDGTPKGAPVYSQHRYGK